MCSLRIWGPRRMSPFIFSIWRVFLQQSPYVQNARIRVQGPLSLSCSSIQSHEGTQWVLASLVSSIISVRTIISNLTLITVWKNVFHLTRPSFSTALAETRSNFIRHKGLVEEQANLLRFDQFRRDHEKAELQFAQHEKVEIQRQQMETLEWLAMTSETTPATDQELYASKRKGNPTSGQWLSSCRVYQEWIDPQTTHIPCIWLNGKPGAGMRLCL